MIRFFWLFWEKKKGLLSHHSLTRDTDMRRKYGDLLLLTGGIWPRPETHSEVVLYERSSPPQQVRSYRPRIENLTIFTQALPTTELCKRDLLFNTPKAPQQENSSLSIQMLIMNKKWQKSVDRPVVVIGVSFSGWGSDEANKMVSPWLLSLLRAAVTGAYNTSRTLWESIHVLISSQSVIV